MNQEAFAKIYADLPHNVALFYSSIKREFKLTHDQAYLETLKYARKTGQAKGQPGLPAHEGKITLLLRKEA